MNAEIVSIVLACMALVLVCVTWMMMRRRESVRAVVFTRAWQKLSRDQIAKQLAGWGETDPRWRALWDLYGEEFETVLMEVHQLPPTLEAMLEWKGRMQMVLHLRAQLLNLRGQQQPEG